MAAGLGFLTTRQAWFAIQSIVLMAAMVVLARWIGGASGLLVLLLVPIVWLSPTTRLTLQIGNFQITAFALSIMAMIAFDRGRAGRGGFALGFSAVSKIYPGVLGIALLVERRWARGRVDGGVESGLHRRRLAHHRQHAIPRLHSLSTATHRIGRGVLLD